MHLEARRISLEPNALVGERGDLPHAADVADERADDRISSPERGRCERSSSDSVARSMPATSRLPHESVTAKIGVSARPTASSSTTARVIGSPFAHVASFWISDERSPTSSPTASTSARQASRLGRRAEARELLADPLGQLASSRTSYACASPAFAHRLRERGVLLEPSPTSTSTVSGPGEARYAAISFTSAAFHALDPVDDDRAGSPPKRPSELQAETASAPDASERVEALRRVLTDRAPGAVAGRARSSAGRSR